jgi:transposase
MSEKRKKYDREFRDGAVRIARRRVSRSRRWPVQGDIEKLKRRRAENAELRMERDVLK